MNGVIDEAAVFLRTLSSSEISALFAAATHLIAVHSQGVANVELKGLDENPVIRLQRWGRVEGTIAEYDKPLTNEEVWLQWREPYNFSPRSPGLDLFYGSSRSDSAGHFAFDNVLPGKCALYRMIPMHDGMTSSSSVEITQVQPGGRDHARHAQRCLFQSRIDLAGLMPAVAQLWLRRARIQPKKPGPHF